MRAWPSFAPFYKQRRKSGFCVKSANCKIMTLYSVFQTERRLDRGHLGATSGARAALPRSRWSALGNLLVAVLVWSPELIIGFCACSVSPSSQQGLCRLKKKMNQGIEWDSGDPRPSALGLGGPLQPAAGGGRAAQRLQRWLYRAAWRP